MEDRGSITGARKAAIFLMVMGEEFTANVFKHLKEDEIKLIGEQMTNLGQVDSGVISSVLNEFVALLRGTSIIGGSGDKFFERTVSKALNPKKAGTLMEELGSTRKGNYFEKLKTLAPEMIVNFISNEHPQTIALILANLNYQTAAEVIKLLPEAIQTEVVVRIAKLDTVPDEIIDEIQSVLEHEVSGLGDSGPQKMGGIEVAAEILNQIDRKTEKIILEKIEEEEEDLADNIRQSMFIFEDLATLDDRSIRALLKEISNDELILALKTASDTLKEKIFSNLSQRAAEMLKEDMEVMGPVRVKEVEQAQRSIIKTARRLEEEGKIVLGGRGGDDIIV
ncbi:MAG: flagellar motor switch protein FliG [Deltaproteobacteria bacterium]|nr:flagellar motor switch protein FliG [Deltaproteobacteria bacterium]MBW1928474.1 flagellar motor switch protein FliG [Deltaproteobacteria bacterium]MBW2024191.1 flagellar motor switch protein FliG [Deltaproteobacteria bacterium]MBW2124894.1 flagellar motor switch protein FliG [Deltaproteobacteria bacterium]RLB20197.1 MAG: flagellar motor switch protein FliG [Deltaproteobacteria bacterium]